ncbi:MAG TPA: uracil-DNA glycosylase [Candidatus Kapabacteria bacterium]|nr:uracil-DNA glycosylase [Candidatus Kapabacteria bacterium]
MKKEPAKSSAKKPVAPVSAALFEQPAFTVPLMAGYAHVHEEWTKADSLDALNGMICTCMKCPLGQTRTKFVFGVGNPKAKLMVIGEAPGADEDKQGEPFVGRAGQLLNKILEAVKFTREEVYICNILKCRPPGNRDPLPSEEDQCVPYLYKQIDLIRPKLILAVGRIAANRLLQKNLSMKELRTQPNEFHGIPFFATYHPAALLRNPNWKHETWEDVQKLRKKYDELINE